MAVTTPSEYTVLGLDGLAYAEAIQSADLRTLVQNATYLYKRGHWRRLVDTPGVLTTTSTSYTVVARGLCRPATGRTQCQAQFGRDNADLQFRFFSSGGAPILTVTNTTGSAFGFSDCNLGAYYDPFIFQISMKVPSSGTATLYHCRLREKTI